VKSISYLSRIVVAIFFTTVAPALFAQSCPIISTPVSPVTPGTTVSLNPGSCPIDTSPRLGCNRASGEDIFVWSPIGGAPPFNVPIAQSSATVTLNTPGNYTYRVNRQFAYTCPTNTGMTGGPPFEIVYALLGDTDITISVVPPLDITPDQFNFLLQVDQQRSSTCQATTTITGINAPSPVTAPAGVQFSIDGGAFLFGTGTINNGQNIAVRTGTAAGFSQTTKAIINIGAAGGIGGTNGELTCTTIAEDATPDAFSFNGQIGVTRSTLIVSNAQTITGINTSAPISVFGGEYSINGRAFTNAAGVINNGESVTVRHTSSASANANVQTQLIVGSLSAQFVSTTAAAIPDTAPDAFSFALLSGVAFATLQTSTAQTINGIDTPSPIFVTGGEYAISGGAFTTAAGTITNGQTVTARHVSAATPGTDVSTTINIGGVVGEFRSTTLGPDSTPNAFVFAAQTGVPRSTLVTSSAVTITGINVASAVSVAGGEYAIGAAAFTTAPGTINNGDTVRVRHTSAAGAGSTVLTTLVIGGVSSEFRSSTAGADTTPDAFTFAAQTGVALSTAITSNAQTIVGIDTPSPVSVVGGDYAINGGTFTNVTGTVNNNDSVQVRHTSAVAPLTDTNTTLTIGGVSAVFRSNTASVAPTQSPIIEIVSPVNGDQYVAPANILVRVEVSDPAGITQLRTLAIGLSGDRRSVAASALICIRPRAARCVVYTTSFTNVSQARYAVDAALTYLVGNAEAVVSAASVQLRVVGTTAPPLPSVVVSNIVLNGAAPILVPGGDIVVSVKAVDAAGTGVRGVALSWIISNVNLVGAQGQKRDTRKAVCAGVAGDAPNAGTLLTDALGKANFQFKASCVADGREITVSTNSNTPAIQQKFQLVGANQRASEVSLVNQVPGSTIIVTGATTLTAQTTNGATPVAGAFTVWSLSPPTAGTVTPRLQSDENGRAVNSVTLAANVTAATLLLCIENKTDRCKSYTLKAAATVLTAPVSAISAPIIQQAVTGTRVQLNQMTARMQQLRSEQSSDFYNGVGVSVPATRPSTDGSNSSDSATNDRPKEVSDKTAPRTASSKPWGSFSLGNIELSQRQGVDGFKVTTQGLTAGVDYRMAKSWVTGATLGYLRGDTDLNLAGKQKATGYSTGLFMQWTPESNVFANVAVNAGRGRYQISRTDVDGTLLSSSPKSEQLGIQSELGYMWNSGAGGLRAQPYLRAELTRANIDPIMETGGTGAIAIDAQKIRATTFAFGATVDRTFSTTSGVWIPSMRLELLNETRKQNDSFARLVNGSAVFVPLTVEPLDKQFGTFAFNLQWLTGISGVPISSFVGYEHTFGKSGFKNNRFLLGIKIPL
jgi:Autotransporter beta-domain